MKKLLSITASNQVIKHWQDKGYEIVYIFTPDENYSLKPKMADKTTMGFLDPELEGSW